jgi:hypothetical protein
MIRACSLLGLAAVFLIISPPLRGTVLTGIAQTAAALERYSPYSYAALVLVLVGLLMLTFYKASVPR